MLDATVGLSSTWYFPASGSDASTIRFASSPALLPAPSGSKPDIDDEQERPCPLASFWAKDLMFRVIAVLESEPSVPEDVSIEIVAPPALMTPADLFPPAAKADSM